MTPGICFRVVKLSYGGGEKQIHDYCIYEDALIVFFFPCLCLL